MFDHIIDALGYPKDEKTIRVLYLLGSNYIDVPDKYEYVVETISGFRHDGGVSATVKMICRNKEELKDCITACAKTYNLHGPTALQVDVTLVPPKYMKSDLWRTMNGD